MIRLLVLVTAALIAGATPTGAAAEDRASERLQQVASPNPSETAQFDALHQAKVREYFADHKAALVPPVSADAASIKLGAPVPESVHLFPLPDAIFTDMPTTPVYLYFRWGNAIVVADVDTRIVVSIIPGIS